jgi:hypothetical protein
LCQYFLVEKKRFQLSLNEKETFSSTFLLLICGGDSGGGGDVLGDVLGVLFGTGGITPLDCRGSGVICNLPNSSLSIIH